MSNQNREECLVAMLQEMQGAEPEGLDEAGVSAYDALDHDADSTVGMWAITWDTASSA
jgi:hypothetical protein